MYLTRIKIDTDNRIKLRDLRHLGAYHGWVESCFDDKEAGRQTDSRRLWRIDKLGGSMYLLIKSEQKPNVTELYKYGVKGTEQVKEYGGYIHNLQKGQVLRFKVTLNPTVKSGGRELPHITTDFQLKYLYDRCDALGFGLKHDEVGVVESKFEPLKRSYSTKPISVVSVTYEGLLEVTDRDEFVKTLTEGFGSKKAFGFGLMTVVPIL